jgi:hypothetical protein
MAQATIILELFKSGIHLTCEDAGLDEFIPHGDGNKLVDLINKIEFDTDPDATFALTDKGKYVAKLMDEDGLSFEEACEKADEEYGKK